ncbi:MAG: hypothetical protein GC155_15680 [Alphaproteobacteria bacterium]|nr:hypothetical protein [Alphaproteobacteria bacterium]
MNRPARSDILHQKISLLAEHMARLIEMLDRSAAAGRDVTAMEEKMAVLEGMLWRLHASLKRGREDEGGRLAQ